MQSWETCYEVRQGKKVEISEPLRYRRGLLQGDSLSPVLYVLSIAPISTALRNMRMGFTLGSGTMVSHLAFMDDLRLYASKPAVLNKLVSVVKTAANDVGAVLNPDKCAEAHRSSTKMLADADVKNPSFSLITEGLTYKYLGMPQGIGTKAKDLKAKVTKDLLERAESVWSSKLSMKHMVVAYNQGCIGMLRYYLGAQVWTQKDVVKLDIAVRRIMRTHHVISYHQATARLYIEVRHGGLGLQRAETFGGPPPCQ